MLPIDISSILGTDRRDAPLEIFPLVIFIILYFMAESLLVLRRKNLAYISPLA